MTAASPRAAQLQASIDTIAGAVAQLQLDSKERDVSVHALAGRMDGIERRMESYESQAKQLSDVLLANSGKLTRVDETITRFTNFGKSAVHGLIVFAKWCLGIVSGVVIVIVAYWFMMQLHIHP